MERNVTLTSDDIAIITLAIQDKVNNIRLSAKVSGITLSETTERRLHDMLELIKNLNNWN